MRKWQRGHGMGGAQESNLIKLFMNLKEHAQVTSAQICSYLVYQNTFRAKLSHQQGPRLSRSHTEWHKLETIQRESQSLKSELILGP